MARDEEVEGQSHVEVVLPEVMATDADEDAILVLLALALRLKFKGIR